MGTKSGFSIILALGVLVVVTTIAYSVQLLMSSGERGQRIARINFVKSVIENRIRLKLSLPESYSCVQDASALPLIKAKCSLSVDFWNQFKKEIPGARCDSSSLSPGIPCGINVFGPLLTSTSPPPDDFEELPLKIKNVKLQYTGNDIFIRNNTVLPDIEVPTEAILSSSVGACASGIFKGIQKDGSIKCDPLPNCIGQEGTYFTGLDANGSALCKQLSGIDFNPDQSIKTVKGIDCSKLSGSGDYIQSISFDPSRSGSPFSGGCGKRVDPCKIGDPVSGSATLCPAP